MGIFQAMGKAAAKEIKKSVRRKVKKMFPNAVISRNAPKTAGMKTTRKKKIPASSVTRRK